MAQEKSTVLGTVSVVATVENLRRVTTFLQECCHKSRLSEREQHDLLLAVEEAYVNVTTYAYPTAGGMVRMRCTATPAGGVLVEIEDDGQPFNPLEHTEPELDKDVHSRKIGGLGIFLIRKLVDTVEYERQGTTNKLLLLKRNTS